MATVYATIANGGTYVQPRLVRATVAPDGTTTPVPAGARHRVLGTATTHTLTEMLAYAVRDGTGYNAQIGGYQVAGKTGTANRVDPVRGIYKGYTASFAGFAPADDPQVTVYCAIQNPTKGSYFGGQICGPIYKKVMEFALKTLQTAPSGSDPARLPVSFEPGE